MASDRDDRWDGDDPRDDRRRRPDPDAARAKVATPATMMILTGILCLILSVVGVGVMASGYDAQVAMLEWMEGLQPAGKARDDFKKEVEKARTRDKSAEHIQNVVFGVIGVIANVLILVGGVKMKQLKGYPLAMTGAVAAIVPLNSCCCIALPIGIWALTVLVNSDVKAAFAANSGRRTDRDDRDAGWGETDRG